MPPRTTRRNLPLLLVLLVVTWIADAAPAQNAPARHTFTAGTRQFLLDGKPYQIISGEMHYVRVPRAYWRDRFRKARAMGLNTISTYAFWNVSEPRPGVWDFSGQNDIAEYIREAQQEGLHVILRPGPYVCAEWELGGYPSWLLKDRSLVLRSDDPKYTAAVKQWFARLAQEVRPLLLSNGGPILALQVENEYGAFGDDKVYLGNVKKQMIEAGLGNALLFTSNQPGDIAKGSLPELPTVVNFGTGDAAKGFAALEQARPDGPRMTGEYWAGWFDKWGEKHHATNGQQEAEEFRFMLEHGYSVNLYMFHGGTTFGWMNGADTHHGTDYHPDTTSYDYDAPLDEKGEPRYKFELFRNVIADVTHTTPPPLPSPLPRDAFEVEPRMLSASLWRNLPVPVSSGTPLTFEDLDQSYGYVLYRTSLTAGPSAPLVLDGLHDYAQVYLDQQFVGTLDRRDGATAIALPARDRAATLDILVENTGRVNYSRTIRTERTGLTKDVTLGGVTLANWQIYSLPMDDLSTLRFTADRCTGPCFFRTQMDVRSAADTYLDTRALHKGEAWVDEHNLGRFWSIGPVYDLFVPAPWLQNGANTLILFDLLGDGSDRVSSVHEPIYGASVGTREAQ